MPTPFSRFHTDSVSIEKSGGTSGRGRPIAGAPPTTAKGIMLKEHKQQKSPDGAVIDYRGTFEYDSSRYDLALGDILVSDSIKYEIADFKYGGDLPQFKDERTAMLKWLV